MSMLVFFDATSQDAGLTAYLFYFISITRRMKSLHGLVMLCSPALFAVRGLHPAVLHGSLAYHLFTTVALRFCLGHNNTSVFCPMRKKPCVLFSHMVLKAALPFHPRTYSTRASERQ